MPDLRETIEGEVYDAICSHFTIWGKPKAQDVCAEGEPDWAIAETVKRATDAILAALSPSEAEYEARLEKVVGLITQAMWSPGPVVWNEAKIVALAEAILSAQRAGGVKPGSLPDGEGG